MNRIRIPIYQVDAFSSEVFAGNPAAVCVLESQLDPATMQSVAAENNLAETAFIVRRNAGVYDLRWFTPEVEIDLCGHATLASGFVVFSFLEPALNSVAFDTASGRLTVTRESSGRLVMDFPTREPERVELTPKIVAALGGNPLEAWLSRDLLVLYGSEREIAELQPDFGRVAEIEEGFAVMVTATGDRADFVSRFFAPKAGVPEDPVTGSAHCTLIPFWSRRLDKSTLHARQISRRSGDLHCEHRGERVLIKGDAALYLTGHIDLPPEG